MENKHEWINRLALQIGDLVCENLGGCRQTLPYVVVSITEDSITCRLLKNSQSEQLLKVNKNYCSKDKSFILSKLGSFPLILKMNQGYQDTDAQREENLKSTW